MTAALLRKSAASAIPAEHIFRKRAKARAILYVAWVYDLHEAVDKLQADAKRDGLVDHIGPANNGRCFCAIYQRAFGEQDVTS
jgi:hypothetical protein